MTKPRPFGASVILSNLQSTLYQSLYPIDATQFPQVSKMMFLLIALSFMTAAWLLKYDVIVEHRLTQFGDGKQLIEAGQERSFEDSEMNNAPAS